MDWVNEEIGGSNPPRYVFLFAVFLLTSFDDIFVAGPVTWSHDWNVRCVMGYIRLPKPFSQVSMRQNAYPSLLSFPCCLAMSTWFDGQSLSLDDVSMGLLSTVEHVFVIRSMA